MLIINPVFSASYVNFGSRPPKYLRKKSVERTHPKRISLVLFFIFLLRFLPLEAHAATYIGEIETGLTELRDFTYPVYIFVPPIIQPERKYPLIISIPDPGEAPEKNIELWTSIAKRQSLIVLVPTSKRIEDVPFDFDRWFFQLKAVVVNKYPVNPTKIYLIGNMGGAHYAAYLGINFPEEFSAVALLGGSWIGKYEKLMKWQDSPTAQLPFFVVLKEDQEQLFQETQARAYVLDQKGYPIRLTRFQKGEEYLNSDFKKELLKWLEEKSESWQVVVQKREKTFKEKARRAIKNFFVV
jgi:hypothetical protein